MAGARGLRLAIRRGLYLLEHTARRGRRPPERNLEHLPPRRVGEQEPESLHEARRGEPLGVHETVVARVRGPKCFVAKHQLGDRRGLSRGQKPRGQVAGARRSEFTQRRGDRGHRVVGAKRDLEPSELERRRCIRSGSEHRTRRHIEAGVDTDVPIGQHHEFGRLGGSNLDDLVDGRDLAAPAVLDILLDLDEPCERCAR